MNTIIFITDLIEKAVLVMLVLLSIWSIAIIFDRRKLFKSFFSDEDFNSCQNQIKQLKPIENKNHLFSEVISESLEISSSKENFERAYSSVVKLKKQKLEKGLSVLATLGANAPFIGLFGTVLGIIRAFAFLGSQSGSQAVMSGVSQALYATAVGLLVAIPAVVAYNYFSNQIKIQISKLDSLRDLYLAKKGS